MKALAITAWGLVVVASLATLWGTFAISQLSEVDDRASEFFLASFFTVGVIACVAGILTAIAWPGKSGGSA